MGGLHKSPRLRFGRTRARQRVATVALNGADPTELAAALRWAESRRERSLRVAVDGGIAAWRARRRRADLFVGDGDSGAPPPGVETVIFPADKPYSDLSGALNELAQRRIRLVVIAGTLGGRLDHEWVNLAELARAAPLFDGIVAPTARGWMLITAGRVRAETIPGRTFTLMSLGEARPLTLRGARWQLTDETLSTPSHGLSNVTGRRLDLSLRGGVAALIFSDEST